MSVVSAFISLPAENNTDNSGPKEEPAAPESTGT